VQQIDAIRYAILHAFGGVYLDVDVRCMKPLDLFVRHFAQNYSVFVEPIHIMASPPRHPLWKAMMDRIRSDPNHAWRVAGGQLEEHARPFQAADERILIDRTRDQEKRAFFEAGFLTMLGVSTWQWKKHQEDTLHSCNEAADQLSQEDPLALQ
jgi:hypothetical protein